MKKRVVVISLGGSLIIPNEIDVEFLKRFKDVIKKNSKNYKFIVVCGGGSIARKYITALRSTGINEKLQNFAGISANRTNARFLSYFFNYAQQEGIPQKISEVEKYLKRQSVVFCGALEYHEHQTSDSTAAQIAGHFKTEFINLTNIAGVYDRDPKKFKNARFISEISWKDFYKLAHKSKFHPGQHFVLDQGASKIIMDKKITTYILGRDLRQLDNLLNGRNFVGSTISG
ncbi:UMP kinase [Candidatus Pacearchaeota archaeon]|nr:UMP kinase [Candidatus Pacearchaeota archaeon]